MNNRKLKAIDLYSGIGGWSVGLEAAGIEVVRCYEWWDRALDTYNQNLSPVAKLQDIRSLKPEEISCGDIDVVVGSPPCTQFSYANRGGSGDIVDGLIDIAKFLEVVDYLQPKFWAMENVPRVANILKRELASGGQLANFAHLVDVIEVVDISDFGLPQRRKRMIAGRFPFALLDSYKEVLPKKTLGDVLKSLGKHPVLDPNYKICVEDVSELENERPLDEEEQRLNLEAKQYHPVYNKMSFPDELGRPARTVTALCTRVSRESIIVQDVTSPNEVRRLSIRERACLQGFPITYQFFGKSHSEKAKLIGNAIPPLLTYYIANSMLGIESHELMPTTKIIPPNKEPLEPHPVTSPPVSGRKFPKTRSFRAALKGLRFGSGMRFELVNNMEDGLPRWKTAFYFGNSKDIKEVLLDSEVLDQINLLQLSSAFQAKCTEIFSTLTGRFAGMTHDDIQKAWTRHIDAPGPFIVADALGEAGMLLAESLEKADLLYAKDFTLKASGNGAAEPLVNGARKLAENSPQIFAGIIICSFFNSKGVALLDRVKSAA